MGTKTRFEEEAKGNSEMAYSIAYLCIGLDYFFNFLETKVYLEKLSLQSGDEWSHRLQDLFSTNKAENMSKTYHTVSQSICYRLSFGILRCLF